LILEDSKKTQIVFQKIKIQLGYGRNPNSRSYSWKRTSQNGTGENQGSKRIEDTDKDQRCRKLPRICKLLQTIHSEFQPHSEAIKQTERKKRMGVERRTSMSL